MPKFLNYKKIIIEFLNKLRYGRKFPKPGIRISKYADKF